MRLVSLAASLLAAGPLLSGQTATGSSIAGQVVDARTGAPVKGAGVSLHGPFTIPAIGPHDHVTIPPGVRATADDRGSFSFSGLAAGFYFINPSADGYAWFDGEETRVTHEHTRVGEGEQVKGVLVKMERLGTIAGRITGENGAPIQGARIAVYRYANGNWSRSSSTGQTGQGFFYADDRGEYRVFGVAPGPYVVSASYPYSQALGDAAATPGMGYPTRFSGGAIAPDKAAAVMVATGEMARADIRLTRSAAYRVSGVVQDSNGPLAGQACVGISPAGSPPSSLLLVGSIGRQDQGGGFTIDALAPGRYTLAASNCPDQPRKLGLREINVSGNMEGVTVRLLPPNRLVGSVESDGCGSLSGIRLNLRPLPFFAGGPLLAVLTSGGEAVFENELPLPFHVEFSELPAGCYVKSVQYGGQDFPVAGAEARGGAAIQIVVSNHDAAQLTGTVINAAGHPVKFAFVAAIASDGGPLAASRVEMADAAGAYRFSALRPGEYKLTAWAEGVINPVTLQAASPRLLRLHDAKAVTVKAAAGSPQSTQLRLITLDEIDQAIAKP